jgi:hypothetical protein
MALTNYYELDLSKRPRGFYEHQITSLSMSKGASGSKGSGEEGAFFVNGAFVNAYGDALGPTLIEGNWSNGESPLAYKGNRGAVAVVGSAIKVRKFINNPVNDTTKNPAKPFETGLNVVR